MEEDRLDNGIFIYWKEGIEENLRKVVIDGANTFVDVLRNCTAIGMPEDEVVIRGVNSTLETFVRFLPKTRGLIDAGAICRKLEFMIGNSSFGIYLTDEPIANGTSYVVGLSFGYGITVSTYHFRDLSNSERLESLKLCVMHELGHVHGMAKLYGRVKSENNCGNHCKDLNCLMQQPFGDFSTLIRKHYRNWFCDLCLEDARRVNIDKRKSSKSRKMVAVSNLSPKKRATLPLPPRKDT